MPQDRPAHDSLIVDSLIVDSPSGRLRITAENAAITRLSWLGDSYALPAGGEGTAPVLAEAANQLGAYFTGRLQAFDLPLAPAGSAFHIRAWQALSDIPFGEVRTYGDIARHLGSSARAVGTACARNPIPIIIPCHRVVGTGSDGGFSGGTGLPTKYALLALEGVTLPGSAQLALL